LIQGVVETATRGEQVKEERQATATIAVEQRQGEIRRLRAAGRTAPEGGTR